MDDTLKDGREALLIDLDRKLLGGQCKAKDLKAHMARLAEVLEYGKQ